MLWRFALFWRYGESDKSGEQGATYVLRHVEYVISYVCLHKGSIILYFCICICYAHVCAVGISYFVPHSQ